MRWKIAETWIRRLKGPAQVPEGFFHKISFKVHQFNSVLIPHLFNLQHLLYTFPYTKAMCLFSKNKTPKGKNKKIPTTYIEQKIDGHYRWGLLFHGLLRQPDRPSHLGRSRHRRRQDLRHKTSRRSADRDHKSEKGISHNYFLNLNKRHTGWKT